MKRILFFQSVLLCIFVIFSTSCNNSRLASKRSNYPVVKRIKSDKAFHADFRSPAKGKSIKKPNVQNDKERKDLSGKGLFRVKVEQSITRAEIDAIREAGSRLEMPAKTLAKIKHDRYSVGSGDDEILASLDKRTLEYVILKKALQLTEKGGYYMQDPQKPAKNPVGFGIASFVIGVVGIFIAGIPAGLLAIIFASISLSRYAKYGGKLKGFAIAGLVLGIIDILGALLAISMM
jgi:hypothetical protein